MSNENIKPVGKLDSNGRKLWKYFIDLFKQHSIQLKSTDAYALTHLVKIQLEIDSIDDEIKNTGLLIEDYNNRGKLVKKTNPLLNYKRQLYTQLTTYLNGFGLTPKSRKVITNKIDQNDSNNFNSEWNF